MVQTPVKALTLESFLSLIETKPASELIDGQVIQKPMPKGKHSVIQSELTAAVNRITKPAKVAIAFTELRCSFGGNALVPDISVLLRDRIPRDEYGAVADIFSISPDWVIEILSPGQTSTKVTKKILHCLSYGTQMGWLIDPTEQSVVVYLNDQLPVIYDQLEAQLPVPDFSKGLKLTVGELFGWLMI
ncbi:MAG: Uma2 family endonuclease [Phormidesmis sp.]